MAAATLLIPVGVRIAAREAMVGLYLGQIDDLFQMHGFNDRDASLGGQGQRRTRVEQFQAKIDFTSPDQVRHYLDLLSDVLDFVPEGDHPRDAGRVLRRALSRAGLMGADGRLRLTIDQQPQPSDADVEGIWGRDKVRVFFSHVHDVRAEVRAIADVMDRMNCYSFVAHTQIEGGRDWQDVIEDALRTCHVLVAYVTDGFQASRWTDQEVGWALGRSLPVVPVNAGLQPYGFFGSIQSIPVSPGNPWLTATAIFRAIAVGLFRPERAAGDVPGIVAWSVVQAVCASPSYDSTRARFAFLDLIPHRLWTQEMVNDLERAAVENSQVRECALEIPSHGRRYTPAPEAIADLVARIRGRST